MQKLARLGEMIASGEASASVALELQDLLVRVLGTSDSSQVSETVKGALPFVIQLAHAESADEVTKLLEAAAAPVGSYALKEKRSMVSLTAFAGATIGFEHIAGSWGEPFGVFAPVGVHVSWPAGKDGKSGDWGVMLSVVNLGNLVSERLDSDLKAGDGTMTVSPEQSESFRSVFSPGVFVTRSIAGPFDVGAGVQVVPSERNVTTTTTDAAGTSVTETDKRAAVQLLVFVGADITIFPF
jgi:hypothetical protein